MGPWSGTAKSISKFFNTKRCVCTNKNTNEIFIPLPCSCLRGGTCGAGVQIFFSEHDHVAYPIKGNDESNRIQVKILS